MASDNGELPQPAQQALNDWLGDRVGMLVHAWAVEEDTVLAVMATVTEEAFDEETDGYDVDSIELHMVTVFDTLQEGWEVSDDSDLKLGTVFGELANRYVEATEDL